MLQIRIGGDLHSFGANLCCFFCISGRSPSHRGFPNVYPRYCYSSTYFVYFLKLDLYTHRVPFLQCGGKPGKGVILKHLGKAQIEAFYPTPPLPRYELFERSSNWHNIPIKLYICARSSVKLLQISRR